MSDPVTTDSDRSLDRWRATKAVLPFLLLGLADVALILWWGLRPLWGFLILPPILFISVLGWIAFRTGFVRDQGDGGDESDWGPEVDSEWDSELE